MRLELSEQGGLVNRGSVIAVLPDVSDGLCESITPGSWRLASAGAAA